MKIGFKVGIMIIKKYEQNGLSDIKKKKEEKMRRKIVCSFRIIYFNMLLKK